MTRDELIKVRDALADGNGWAGHALADHDEKYARHPATEADREFITDSQNKIVEALRILDRALAAPEQEPVVYWDGDRSVIPADDLSYIPNWSDYYPTPLYRHPAPQSAQPMQWIDVSERVPDEAQIVLFVLKGKVVVGAWIAGIFWYDNAKQVASAWMPLPPPPELGVGGYPITAPPAAPAREWQDLSPLEMRDTLRNCAASTFDKLAPHWYEVRQFAHAIESALKAKNTGEQA